MNSRTDMTNDGFFRVAAAAPELRVADVEKNAAAVLDAVREAAADGVGALALPELCLTGYTCGDLFHDRALLAAAERALARILAETADLPILFAVGLPVCAGDAVYNCAAVCVRGELMGLTAKTYLPNYGEFYEQRWFRSAPSASEPLLVTCAGQEALLASGLVYQALDVPDLVVGVEICEDLWAADPPSTHMAEAGATLILNLSASDEVIGKAAYRRQLVSNQSARLYCAYAYANAGFGESTTDLVFSGHSIVAENGALLAQTPLFAHGMAATDVDLERLRQERRRSTTWRPSPDDPCACLAADFELGYVFDEKHMTRTFERAPFVPAATDDLRERCEVILGLQTEGLATRLHHTGSRAAVIGVSGGLDSTLALIVCVRAFDRLGLDRAGITAVSMPGFGTTSRTRSNALGLAEALGVTVREIPIGPAVKQHFADIGHDPSVTDVTYENSQARERTQILMDVANEVGGFVVGTGDLSELALGWATYNADHMSMYGVNASVPKTLVRHLVRYAAGELGGTDGRGRAAEQILLDVLDTPVSPELLPPKDGEIAQRTEDLVGPYELHDFFLYYVLRFGFAPGKIYRMARRTFEKPATGEAARRAGTGEAFDARTVWTWLRTFYRRFFAQQFKRSCLPDGPKVGSVTLSPRGDWRMPSDAASTLWLAEIDALEPAPEE